MLWEEALGVGPRTELSLFTSWVPATQHLRPPPTHPRDLACLSLSLFVHSASEAHLVCLGPAHTLGLGTGHFLCQESPSCGLSPRKLPLLVPGVPLDGHPPQPPAPAWADRRGSDAFIGETVTPWPGWRGSVGWAAPRALGGCRLDARAAGHTPGLWVRSPGSSVQEGG